VVVRRNRQGHDRSTTSVTLIPGDGIGPEVTEAALRVIDAVGIKIEWDRQLAGAAAFREYGDPVPEGLIRSLKRTRIALKGPLETRVAVGFRSINVYLRKNFDLYASIRPVHSFEGVHTPFHNVNLIVVRENTEDLYTGLEHQVTPGVVESIKVITARASKRIAKFAFEFARKQGRQSVTAIHKANIMKLSDGLFLKCAREVAKLYP
jgi:isocitrate dehydrogenase (NAD+)